MSTPSTVVDVDPLLQAVLDRLEQLPPTTAAIDGSTTTSVHISHAVDVPQLDADGHVQRYCVIHPWGGTDALDDDLAETSVDLVWGFGLNVVAFAPRDALALAVDAKALLFRWAPQVTGLNTGRLMPPDGYQPGPVRVDRDERPYRYFLPLQYRTTVTR